MSRRIQKVNSLIKEELGKIIFNTLEFDKNLVTLTEVNTSSDLQHATVKISIYPSDNTKQVLEKLKRNIYSLQQQLNKKLYIRPVPKIRFELDKHGKKVDQINQALDKIREEE